MSDYANLMQWDNFPEDRDPAVCRFCKEEPATFYGHCAVHHTDPDTFHPSGGWDDYRMARMGRKSEPMLP